ncbi:hypothetical protein SteCoe_18197 [Stentor coeruleus]|uniref:Cyclin-dependent kinase 2 homolog n=1 Tax=Stentor coeruleus TaxID=5963 RepID=A0A1R2BXK2_9CILI|nr:hypothetical protein SteCoe_18197 [Stentor coeruleus]
MNFTSAWRCRPASNFEKLDQVGEGTYGNVFKARERITKVVFAMKKIKMDREKEGFPITALREIKLLKQMDHPNIIQLKEIITSKSPDERNPGNVYLLFEYMEHDLEGLLNMAKPRIEFTIPHLKSYMKQMLQAIEYLHSKKIVHRDIKCANLLVNNQGQVKLGDFGLARTISGNPQETYTNRVITLWYRPPELLLGANQYSFEVDMWSAGCIIGEILARQPMFPEGDEPKMLQKIYSICGTFNEETWPESCNLPLYDKLGPKEKIERTIQTKYSDSSTYPNFDPLAIDLIDKLLQFNPKKRLTATQALDHPYFHTQPLPCSESELPKVEIEMHEWMVKKQRKERQNREGQKVQPSQYPKPPVKRPAEGPNISPSKKPRFDEDRE